MRIWSQELSEAELRQAIANLGKAYTLEHRNAQGHARRARPPHGRRAGRPSHVAPFAQRLAPRHQASLRSRDGDHGKASFFDSIRVAAKSFDGGADCLRPGRGHPGRSSGGGKSAPAGGRRPTAPCTSSGAHCGVGNGMSPQRRGLYPRRVRTSRSLGSRAIFSLGRFLKPCCFAGWHSFAAGRPHDAAAGPASADGGRAYGTPPAASRPTPPQTAARQASAASTALALPPLGTAAKRAPSGDRSHPRKKR